MPGPNSDRVWVSSYSGSCGHEQFRFRRLRKQALRKGTRTFCRWCQKPITITRLMGQWQDLKPSKVLFRLHNFPRGKVKCE